jgi:hypothetical protein
MHAIYDKRLFLTYQMFHMLKDIVIQYKCDDKEE